MKAPVPAIKKGFHTEADKFRFGLGSLAALEDPADLQEVLDMDEYERFKDQRMGGVFQGRPSMGEMAKEKRYEPTWYTNVEVQKLADGYYGVALDGVPVVARQCDNRHRLVLPSEAWATAVAVEFEEAMKAFGGHDLITPHQMPMYDLASSAQQTGRMGLHERIDLLTASLETDSVIIRDGLVDRRYGVELDNVQEWFDRVLNVRTPRDVFDRERGELATAFVEDAVLLGYKTWLERNVSNKFSLLCLHAIQRYFASTVLATAACFDVVAPDLAMKLGNADELTGVELNGFVRGYHDVRWNDMYTKCYAALLGFRLSQGLDAFKCEAPYKLLVSHRILTAQEQVEASRRAQKERARLLLAAQREERAADEAADRAAEEAIAEYEEAATAHAPRRVDPNDPWQQ